MRALSLLVFLCAAAAQEAPPPPPDAPSLIKAGDAAYLHADYEGARQSFLQAWNALQQAPPEDETRYRVLKKLVSVRIAAGEPADADNYLQMAIAWREALAGPDDRSIVDDLLISAGLYRSMKQYDRAFAALRRILGIYAKTKGDFDGGPTADIYSRMSQLYMDQENPQAAAGALRAALLIRTRVMGPLDVSLVPDLDRLGGILIVLRDYENAEATFRQALVIRETLYGKENADLIATLDGLSYACFGQKKYDEAEPIYLRLLALWGKSVGEDHPMLAIALDKVAVFYAAQEKFEQAKQAADRANAIRAHFLAMGLSTQAAEQWEEGNREAAQNLYERVLKTLDPPDPIYDEIRQTTVEILKSLEPAPKLQQKKAAPKKKKG